MDGAGRPAGGDHRAELLWLTGAILAQQDVLLPQRPAWVGESGVGPQGDGMGGQQVLRVGAARRQGDDRRPAGVHHRQRPGRELDRPRAMIADAVRDRGAIGVIGQGDIDLFADGIARFNGRCGADKAGMLFDRDRRVVRVVGARLKLRRSPQAMPAVDPPLVAAGLAQHVRIRGKQVRPAGKAAVDDARPDIGRDHQFHAAVGQPVAVRPAPIADSLKCRHRMPSPWNARL